MSTITHNGHIGTNLTGSASLRVAICAALAVALTALTMQVIGSATGNIQADQQVAATIEAAAPLPTVLVVAPR